ncbi:conserved exported hypothetical protein [uncultured Dysgonomonas sp.]|uniref:histidine kinase n=1 Tax=uncultured Dysgonomonas sp. TaxID=206096 RepID=A0A212JDK7_9BACT|nr:conserved exported hypothetical protein [uncultured Dysgonomonas sp.]
MFHYRRIISLINLLILTGVYSLSAQYGFSHAVLSDPQKRMSQSVSGMVKDTNGFLWIASRSGITRYDGYNYRHYQLAEAEVMQDNDGRIVYVRMGPEEALWAFTDRGKIYEYSALSDSFKFIDDISIRDSGRWLNDLYLDQMGILWLGTSCGLLRFDAKKPGTDILASSSKIGVNCIIPLSGGKLAIGTTNGVKWTNTETNTTEGETLAEGHNIMSLYYDSKSDLLWIGTFSNGIRIWNVKDKKYLSVKCLDNLPPSPVKAIREWKDNIYLIGFDGRGVYAVDIISGYCEQILSDSDHHGRILKGNGVYDILVDDNNILVATYTSGVTAISERRNFEWISHQPNNEQSIKGSHVYAIHEDRDGDLWFATNQGISLLHTLSGKWTHFLEQYNSFLTICEDKNGKIWTGGYSTGLYRINKATRDIYHIPSLSEASQLDCIYSSYCDAEGDLWFGCLYTPFAQVSFKDGTQKISLHNINEIRSINSFNKRTLFLATSNGFYLFDKYTHKRRLFFNDPIGIGIQSNSFIYSSVVIGDEIWFGTDGGGLNCMNMKTREVRTFSTNDGLLSNFIYGIIKGRNGILWISTDKGVFCFAPSTGKLLYNIDLPTKDFLFMSFAQLSDGRMAFGSTDGAVIFSPDQMTKMENETQLYFTDFMLSYQYITPADAPEILKSPLSETKSISLGHNQNSFSMGFVAPNIYRKHNYTYKYILEGFDEGWTTSTQSTRAGYTNIPAGKYRFRVQCLDGIDGVLLAERELDIIVRKPFWNTYLAWALYGLALAILVYWGWRYYRELMLKKASRERLDFFINVAHDIRTPLSLIMAPLDSLDQLAGLETRGMEYLRLARSNANKLHTMVSQLLEFHKEGMSDPGRQKFTICELQDILKDKVIQFEPLAAVKNLEISIESPPEIIYIETRLRKLDSILDNLLSNAVKYSPGPGNIIVRLSTKGKKAVIEVQDFGIGIAKKEQKKIFREIYRGTNAINSTETGAGIGLMYTYKLMRQIGAELSFESEQGKGTSFFLTFPSYNTGVAKDHSENTIHKIQEKGKRKRSTLANHHYNILLVEDNDDMRNYLSGILSSEYKVYSVPSAEKALDFFKKNKADIVISDIMMSGMRGDELCNQLKSNIETSHIHVILLTAISNKESMIEGLSLGADDYITKPFDVDALKIKVSNALKTRIHLQQYYMTSDSLQTVRPDNVTTETEDHVKPATLDEQFIAKCIKIVNNNISNSSFSVENLCLELAMSRTLVYEKLKALTDQSPNEFIRTIRLRYAKELLLSNNYSIVEVSLMAGFLDAKYFSTAFKRHFGVSPSKIGP